MDATAASPSPVEPIAKPEEPEAGRSDPPAIAEPSFMKIVDINGDHKDDFLVVDEYEGVVRAWINHSSMDGPRWDGGGRYCYGVKGSDGTRVRFANVDRDLDADYLSLAHDNAITVLLRNDGGEPGAWNSPVPFAPALAGPNSIVEVVDVNGDSDPDYLAIESDGSISAWLYSGWSQSPSWTPIPRFQVKEAGLPRFADIDGDGRVDYLVVTKSGTVHGYTLAGAGKAAAWVPLDQVATGFDVKPEELQFANIDGDLRAEALHLALDGSVRIWSRTSGQWQERSGGPFHPRLDGAVRLKSDSNLCVTVVDKPGDSFDAQAFMQRCDDSRRQLWNTSPFRGGLKLVDDETGSCLELDARAQRVYATKKCEEGRASQAWLLDPSDRTVLRNIQSPSHPLCVHALGQDVVPQNCDASDVQLWNTR